jgi:Flp pilus assembly protein TadD
MENKTALLGSAFVAVLFCFALPVISQSSASCVPPDEIKPKLQGTPTVDVYNDLGVLFAKQEKYNCAADAFGSSLQLDMNQPNVKKVIFMFGVSLFYTGETKDAIASLQQAEQFGYREIKIHLILAAALDSIHSTAEAEKEWRATLDMDPEYTQALDALSDDLIGTGDYPGVIDLLERPRLLGQRTPKQSMNLGLAYVKSDKLDEAVRVLRDGLNTTPHSIELANQLAGVLRQLGRNEEADTVVKLAATDAENAGH